MICIHSILSGFNQKVCKGPFFRPCMVYYCNNVWAGTGFRQFQLLFRTEFWSKFLMNSVIFILTTSMNPLRILMTSIFFLSAKTDVCGICNSSRIPVGKAANFSYVTWKLILFAHDWPAVTKCTNQKLILSPTAI